MSNVKQIKENALARYVTQLEEESSRLSVSNAVLLAWFGVPPAEVAESLNKLLAKAKGAPLNAVLDRIGIACKNLKDGLPWDHVEPVADATGDPSED
jgi:hypothetical protein